MNDKPTRCAECGAYQGHHFITCSLQPIEQKASEAVRYYEAWLKKNNEHHAIYMKFQQQAVYWQGKHAILRHENNKLRKAMYRQEKKRRGPPTSSSSTPP